MFRQLDFEAYSVRLFDSLASGKKKGDLMSEISPTDVGYRAWRIPALMMTIPSTAVTISDRWDANQSKSQSTIADDITQF